MTALVPWMPTLLLHLLVLLLLTQLPSLVQRMKRGL